MCEADLHFVQPLFKAAGALWKKSACLGGSLFKHVAVTKKYSGSMWDTNNRVKVKIFKDLSQYFLSHKIPGILSKANVVHFCCGNH